MANVNPVFQAKVEKAFDASIDDLKNNHGVYPDAEMLRCLKIVFCDGITFGVDKSKEVFNDRGASGLQVR